MTEQNLQIFNSISPGSAAHLGAQLKNGGVNFCLHSHSAQAITLHIFQQPEDPVPIQSLALDPLRHRSGDRWHVYLAGCRAGQLYLYTASGPDEPGLQFNPGRFLQDPYAKAITQETGGIPAKCIVVDDAAFDWEDDRPLHYPLRDCIIYEAHLKGMTKNCPYRQPGSYLGVVEHIPYLQELGITSLEFLPLMNFSPYDYSKKDLKNYWGYNTRNFFAPATHYASRPELPGLAVTEFKHMVQALHRAGIEVILDVVFNHSAEADEHGPTFSFRGLDNPTYYILQNDRHFYANFTGCGNTMNCQHPVVRELILDCLRYWVLEMHVDGFRFDLASIFRRDKHGKILDAAHSMVESLSYDSVLAQSKLIAEPWDAAGAYQLGHFAGKSGGTVRETGRWAEWNDRYRDDVRQFWCGGLPVAQLATRFAGSSDLFAGQSPAQSINFLSCHDGFTLRDLFSYNEKHNLANGEENRDGHNHNFNRNYGCEGPTTDPDITHLRCRMIKNHLTTLLLSAGTPMLLAGDELGNSQLGNNNAYCQDRQLSWLPAAGSKNSQNLEQDPEIEAYQSLRHFLQGLITLRRTYASFRRSTFFHNCEIRWFGLQHGSELCELQSSEQWRSQQDCLALLLNDNAAAEPSFFCIFNAGNRLLHFPLPGKPSSEQRGNYAHKHWSAIIDTHLQAPADIVLPQESHPPIVRGHSYPIGAQSVVVFIG